MLRRMLQVMALVCAVAVGRTATAASSAVVRSASAELQAVWQRNLSVAEPVHLQQARIEDLRRVPAKTRDTTVRESGEVGMDFTSTVNNLAKL